MTERERNDAIEYIKAYRKTDETLHKISPEGSRAFFATETCLKYWDMAIKALEQMDVLDKIMAEIEASMWTDEDIRIERNALASGLEVALDIIDKYRKETE